MKCYNTMSAQATETQWHYYSKSVCAHVLKDWHCRARLGAPPVRPPWRAHVTYAGATLAAAPALFTHVSIGRKHTPPPTVVYETVRPSLNSVPLRLV
jgi:hypothetical protein